MDKLEAARHRETTRSAILKTAAGACASFASAAPESVQWIVGFSSAAFEMLWRARESGISSDRLKVITLRAMQRAIDEESVDSVPIPPEEGDDDGY